MRGERRVNRPVSSPAASDPHTLSPSELSFPLKIPRNPKKSPRNPLSSAFHSQNIKIPGKLDLSFVLEISQEGHDQSRAATCALVTKPTMQYVFCKACSRKAFDFPNISFKKRNRKS